MKLSIGNPYSIFLLTNILFSTSIWAAPKPDAPFRFGRRSNLQRRVISHQSHPFNSTGSGPVEGPLTAEGSRNTAYSSNWAGAALTSPPSGQTFNGVSAQWVLPTVSRPPSSSGSGTWYSSEWVGIDGYSDDEILQAGTMSSVTVSRGGSSTTSASAWYEWYPNDSVTIEGFDVSAGDTISVSVHATSSTTGTVVLENLTTGKTVTESVSAPSSSSALAGQNAEWILEDFSSDGGLVPFSDYTTVYFTDCTATTSSETLNLAGATLIDMEQDGTVLSTAVEVSDTELEVYYSG